MEGNGTVPGERFEVLGRPVTAVVVEAVIGIDPVAPVHEAIPDDLGHDAGRGDRSAQGVAVDDRLLEDVQLGDRHVPVDEDRTRGAPEPADRAAHGEKARVEDVEPVDLPGTRPSPRDVLGPPEDQIVEFLPNPGGEQLGIAQARQPNAGDERDGGGDDGPGQTASACLVHADHRGVPRPAEPPLMPTVGTDLFPDP